MKRILAALFFAALSVSLHAESWIRINQLGYLPESTKVAVLMTTTPGVSQGSFEIVDVFSGETVFTGPAVASGPMGQMRATFRLNFSGLTREGTYRIRFADAESEVFPVGNRVYDGAADFVLNYMRSRRCGWNPLIKDSCHTKDGYIVYHPTRNGQHIDVTGGWHDATDCLQYTTTSANAIYQMMFAYDQNPEVFTDRFKADGTPGSNGIPDIIDEVYWGMDWLDRMNPEPGEYYNQIADDRDHVGMRNPHNDPADYGYGPGNGRPVYYCSGEPQMRGRKTGRRNNTEGIASTTGKFASDFSYGSAVLRPFYPEFADKIGAKAAEAFQAGVDKPGACQTASVASPYIYEESNWVDDMELAAAELFRKTGDKRYLKQAAAYGKQEPITPWMGADTARHYQWYPFMNMGHFRLASEGDRKTRKEFIAHMREGIDAVYRKAKGTPFLYGIPGIWCSNNLTTAMLTQCILYRQLTGDTKYEEMEGALRDWLFGCNPWGVSMIVELPLGGNYPRQPHSWILRLGLGNATGGLVDGPVYATIFGSLYGVSMEGGNDYALFQPGDRVYHDSTYDYSTNEPTMDGTACLTFPLSYYESCGRKASGRTATDRNVYSQGGIIRTDPSRKRISLVFTAADMADGADPIIRTLAGKGIKGGFFFTGEFYEKFPDVIRRLVSEGHYVGSHSYGHLLYSSWENRDSMLVTEKEFQDDLIRSYSKMAEFGIQDAPYFIPPYEHYNSLVSSWARKMGLQIVNYTPGTLTNGDYTHPGMNRYFSSDEILDRIRKVEREQGLGGHIMLIHLGTVDQRTDKFYNRLDGLIDELRAKGYTFVPLTEALNGN